MNGVVRRHGLSADLERIARMLGAARSRVLAGRGVVLASAVVVALALMDAGLALPGAIRVPLLAALVAALVVAVTRWRRARKDPVPEVDACRALETATGDGERHVTTAVELFSMEGDLAQAASTRMLTSIPVTGYEARLPRPTLVRALLGMVAIGAMATGIELLLPGFWTSVLPRLAHPWGDHPPFSRTRLAFLTPLRAVPHGGEIRIEVAADGVRPPSVSLCAQPAAGGAVKRLVMFKAGSDRWAAVLGPVREDLVVWAEAGAARTPYRQVPLDPVPVLEAIEVTVRAPAYAGLPEERHEARGGTDLVLRVLAGSKATLQPRANRPLSHVILAPEGGARQELPLVDGSAVVPAPPFGRYALSVRSAEGVDGPAALQVSVLERPDKAPQVRVVEPPAEAVATPGMKIPLVLEATDDLGLVRVTRTEGYNGLEGQPLPGDAAGKRWTHEGSIDLASLGVAPGDRLTVGVVARDGRPTEGQLSPHARRSITIIDEALYYALMRNRAGVEALVRKFSPLLQELGRLREEARAALPKDRARIEKAKADAAKLSETLATMKRPESLVAVEPEIVRRMQEHLERIQKALEAGDPSMLPGAEEEKELTEDLEKLVALSKMQALANHLMQLAQREREVADDLQRLTAEGVGDDARKADLQELAQQQQRIASQLDLWAEQAPAVAKESEQGAPDAAEQLRELAKKLEEGGAMESARDAAREARRPDVPEAARKAADAAAGLEKLTEACQGLGGASQKKALALGMGESETLSTAMSQLAEMAGRSMGLKNPGRGSGGSSGAPSLTALQNAAPAFDEGAPDVALYGPEVAAGSPASGSSRGDASGAGTGDERAEGGSHVRDATAYARETRTTSATDHAVLSPEEQALVDAYFRKLEEAP